MAEKKRQEQLEKEKARVAKMAAQRGATGNVAAAGVPSENSVAQEADGDDRSAEAKLPIAETPDPSQHLALGKSLSVRSSGRDRKTVNYNSMALGTGDESARMDYNAVNETTPTQ